MSVLEYGWSSICTCVKLSPDLGRNAIKLRMLLRWRHCKTSPQVGELTSNATHSWQRFCESSAGGSSGCLGSAIEQILSAFIFVVFNFAAGSRQHLGGTGGLAASVKKALRANKRPS